MKGSLCPIFRSESLLNGAFFVSPSTKKPMKTIQIDYYTGTGGSQFIAEKLAETLKNQDNSVVVNRIFRADITATKTLECGLLCADFPGSRL